MGHLIDQLRREARQGVRALLRNRTFTIITTLTLSLGVALNTTVFSVVNAVMLRPVGYARPNELVTIGNRPGGRKSVCDRSLLRQLHRP